jgi:hypothetical protein
MRIYYVSVNNNIDYCLKTFSDALKEYTYWKYRGYKNVKIIDTTIKEK